MTITVEPPQTVAGGLRAVRELLSAPERWTQGENARDAEGHYVSPECPQACCWCLEGAILRVWGSWSAAHKTVNLLTEVTHEYWLHDWNDRLREHGALIVTLDRAIQLAEERGL